MSPALAVDGTGSFVVFLVVLLAMMLVAVIRQPRWEGSSQEDARPQLAMTAPTDAQARAAAAIARATAMLSAGRVPGPEPGDEATMPLPAAAGQRGQAPLCGQARHRRDDPPAGGVRWPAMGTRAQAPGRPVSRRGAASIAWWPLWPSLLAGRGAVRGDHGRMRPSVPNTRRGTSA